uniref:Glycosyl transferase family 25 domain-containing protein n=1 Tax=viral metagenome TaxID=1070528 RepID=A0A6C0H688_9ZZZZ
MNILNHVLYINLDDRIDRKTHVEQQLNNIGITNFKRFPAIKKENGAIGCSLSHLQCIKMAKENNWDYVFIVEDDILFLHPNLFQLQIKRFTQSVHSWDVLLIGGNNFPPFTKINSSCIQVTKCQTTTGYIVSNHYYDTLIDNFYNGINYFLQYPNKPQLYAIDQYWFKLQERHKWFLLIPICAIQKEDYSDIEKRNVDYKRIMVDYEKKNWNKRF